jgi:phosphoribosylformylglycinamidine synthase PurS subunit
MKYDAQVAIYLKGGVPDMVGKSVLNAMRSANMAYGITDVRVGKMIEIELECHPDRVDDTVQSMCEKLLANQVIENSSYRLIAHMPQPDNSIVKMPLARGDDLYMVTAGTRVPIVEPRQQVYSINLEGKWPAIGPYRILRAEWLRPSSETHTIRYSKNGIEAAAGWRLSHRARTGVFLDTLDSEIGKNRARSLRALAPEISEYIIRQIAVYGLPEPKLLDE